MNGAIVSIYPCLWGVSYQPTISIKPHCALCFPIALDERQYCMPQSVLHHSTIICLCAHPSISCDSFNQLVKKYVTYFVALFTKVCKRSILYRIAKLDNINLEFCSSLYCHRVSTCVPTFLFNSFSSLFRLCQFESLYPRLSKREGKAGIDCMWMR